MKKHVSLFTLLIATTTLWAAEVTPADKLKDYYASLDGKSGKELFDAVHDVLQVGFKTLGYDGLWTAYETTDLYPADSIDKAGLVWDIYSECGFKYKTKQCGNYSKECDCYNREHSIPKSWFCDCKTGMGADIMHLFPTDGKVNGVRSNYAYGEVENASYTSNSGHMLGSAKKISVTYTVLGDEKTIETLPATVFEPLDVYKGDLARAYMGTMCKWTSQYQMNDGDGKWFFNNSYTQNGHFGLAEYGLALLMKWNRQDPVSRKETDRNNGIQKTQGNRNPFVDLPTLAEYIWGEKAGQKFSLQNEPTTSAEGVVRSDVATKVIVDGQMYIIRNGVTYTITGM